MLQSRIRRGELDREITFLKKVISDAPSNADNIDDWVKVDIDPDVFARKRDQTGDVLMSDQRVTYSQRTEWVVDYREDINTENRIVYNGKVYDILSVTDYEDGRERYLAIMSHLRDNETWTV